jgi:hypothetical protein
MAVGESKNAGFAKECASGSRSRRFGKRARTRSFRRETIPDDELECAAFDDVTTTGRG